MDIEKKLREINLKYEIELSKFDKESIDKALLILELKKEKIKGVKYLHEIPKIDINRDILRIKELMESYRMEIKEVFIENRIPLTHISNISPNQMKGKINKSINKPNNYETEAGNWVFASSTPVDGNNPYLARKSKDGMILVHSGIYIYGGDNIDIVNEDGNIRCKLKEPNYVYYLNPLNFKPVVTIKLKENGKPYFEFSNEWISDEEVNLNDRQQVFKVDEIKDITEVIAKYQIFCDVNNQKLAVLLKNSSSKEEAYEKLVDFV